MRNNTKGEHVTAAPTGVRRPPHLLEVRTDVAEEDIAGFVCSQTGRIRQVARIDAPPFASNEVVDPNEGGLVQFRSVDTSG